MLIIHQVDDGCPSRQELWCKAEILSDNLMVPYTKELGEVPGYHRERRHYPFPHDPGLILNFANAIIIHLVFSIIYCHLLSIFIRKQTLSLRFPMIQVPYSKDLREV